MFDSRVVLTQVSQGRYPTYWRVYRGTGNYGCAVGAWIVTACIIFFAYPCFSSSISQGYDLTFLILFFGIPCLICILIAIVAGQSAKNYSRSILVLLPEGVVQCIGGNIYQASWLNYAGIDRIKLAQKTEINGVDGDISTRTFYWLDVYGINGTYRKWWVNGCFGDTAYFCKTIIAAFNYYDNYID